MIEDNSQFAKVLFAGKAYTLKDQEFNFQNAPLSTANAQRQRSAASVRMRSRIHLQPHTFAHSD